MKKTSVVNLTIVIGLLVVCVTTLVVIYSATPESDSTVLLLEENFNSFDGSRWQQESMHCDEDGSRLRYSTVQNTNTYVDGGVLHVPPTSNENTSRTRRAVSPNCTLCYTDEGVGCATSVYATQLRSRTPIQATHGRIELRAKLADDLSLASYIGMVPEGIDSEQISSSYNIIETVTNGTGDLSVYVGPHGNQTLVKSGIPARDYHVYVIEWNNNTLSIKLDGEDICGHFNNSLTLQQPFYINLGVNAEEKRTKSKRSVSDLVGEKHKEEDLYSIDYIKVYRIVE